jgi:hypothetical protein
LKLPVDKEHFYEERFDKVPYVAGNDVYLFFGDNFGVKATITDGEISQITYERELSKADITFKFTEEMTNGKQMMMLIIQNRLKQRLFVDALMTVPNKKGVYKTSILPIEKGLTNFESWPHPIVQLVLRDFRFSEQRSNTPKRDPLAQYQWRSLGSDLRKARSQVGGYPKCINRRTATHGFQFRE